jgi:ATP-binding cassette subfamily F protein uup
MAAILSCNGLAKAFGAQTLFTDITLHVHAGDQIGIIGPNGSGKSTLLRILCGREEPDRGEIVQSRHLRLGYLPQQTTFPSRKSILDCLLDSLEEAVIDEAEKHLRISTILSKAGLSDPETEAAGLSGGWQKRLSICRALLAEPDVLIMDEPTNHLDIEGIIWLEELLQGPDAPSAYLLVSHDRRFLENCSNRVVELAEIYPQGTFQVHGPYSRFLEKREEFLLSQREEENRLANRTRREIEWLRRGPKARTTKARYRIDEAHRLTEDLAEVRARNRSQGDIGISFSSTGRKTKKLLEARGLSRALAGKSLFHELDIVLGPGSRLGLLGPNGCGKTTLMKILATAGQGGDAEAAMDSGTIRIAEGLRIVYFDQQRQQLDAALSLRRALAPEGDSIVYRDRSVHVVTWAKRFLFRPDQLETPVAQLSGGEQARILLASLIRQKADILLLDEPTNDLDISSLDVLESSLHDFPGAVVLVTHDRFLLDRLCDQILGFATVSGTGYYADYRQWLADRRINEPVVRPAKKKREGEKGPRSTKKLSYLDQREYDQIENRITAAEDEVEKLKARLADPQLQNDAEELARNWEALQVAEEAVEMLYNRWNELEEKQEQ